jgi:DNA polymerase I-like protein with 3'-5' exonuclease and polymerase domains
MRIAAHLSRDTEMIRCFNEGIDVHWRTCMNMMETGTNDYSKLVLPTAESVAILNGNPSYSDAVQVMLFAGPGPCIKINGQWYEARTRSKATNFGYIYGMREAKYVEMAKKDYGWEPTMAEAKQNRNAYFALYAQLEAWHKKVRKLARLNGHVRALTGRLRRLPGIHAKDRIVRAEAERQAVNSGVQAMIGDYKAMILVEVAQSFDRSQVRIVGEHHDAVLTLVKDEYVDDCVPVMLKIAARPALMDTFKIKLSVPMEGEAELGPWGKGTKYAA